MPYASRNDIFKDKYFKLERHPSRKGENTTFTGKIRCSICGKNYRRKTTPYNVVWCCSTFNSKGKKYCESKSIPEDAIKNAASDVLGVDCFDASEFLQRVDHIEACPDIQIISPDSLLHRLLKSLPPREYQRKGATMCGI